MINASIYTSLLAELNPLEPVLQKPLFSIFIGPWQVSVSNHMFMVTLATLFLLIAVPLAANQNHNFVPRGLRNLLESICVFFREEVVRPVLKDRTDKYVGFIWTVFFFILTLNLLGLIPIEKIPTLFTGKPNHYGGAATANIWITGAMAVVVFIMFHLVGIKEQGLWKYLVNLAPPVPWPLIPLIYFLELVSSFIRPFTLSIRLFANIIAGHMIIATFIGLILVFKNYGVAVAAVFGAVALTLLDVLVAFIQAYVFAFLCTLYFGFAIEAEH
ncbi:MAG: F0F1 ATP synthase subunit A [Sedimentisphaerales bacterium]